MPSSGTSAPYSHSLRFAVVGAAASVLAFALWLAVAPTTVVQSAAESSDGKWTVSVELLVFQASLATPVTRIVAKRQVLGITLPRGETLVQWNQASAEELTAIHWQGPTNLAIRMPPAAKGAARVSRFGNVEVRYDE